jgi:glucokinase
LSFDILIEKKMQKKSLPSKPVIAVDIGGTKIMGALFSGDGRMLAIKVLPTLAQEGVEPAIERLCSMINEILSGNNISPSQLGAICVASAGAVDTVRGVVETASPHLPGWTDVALADIVEKQTGVATYLINDANAAALGEQRYGVGKGIKNLVLLTLGTGIGGGIIIDGKLYLGTHTTAGELGHMTVAANGPGCGCGNIGCLEVFASGKAIADNARERVRNGEKSSLVSSADGKLDKITSEMVGKAAQSGDKLSQDVIAKAAYYLGVGLVNIVNAFDPEMVIIGGGMSALGDMLIGPGRRMVEAQAFSKSARKTPVVIGQFGDKAGVYGAAAYAFDMKGKA